MFKYIVCFFIALTNLLSAQNDLDAIRYSRVTTNGTSRYAAMGGAFGALGADLSCAAVNPAGLGLYRKHEAAVGFGLRLQNNEGLVNGYSTMANDANFVFNNLGYCATWTAKNDAESRHAFAFTSIQLQNFGDRVSLSNYTNSNSIAKDMLNIANQKKDIGNLNYGYEGAGYDTYLLDYDSLTGQFFSFLDLKRTVLQNRSVVTGGKVSELNFSYAYSFKDQFYFGASIGVPRVSYTSTTTHSESDDKDSMQVKINADGTFTDTYVDGLPGVYADKLGFNSLTYTEYFATTGTGVNLKLGAIFRVNDIVRIGFHYHTPTLYNLTDTYYNSMSVTFDKDKKTPIEVTYPDGGGYFKYKIITPSKFGLSAAFIIDKLAAIGLDYELLNYRNAQLSSTDPADFSGVNSVIRHKYSFGHNVRTGVEFNVKPVFLRAGYNMQGSPFGNAYTGTFVRHTVSLGFGYRTKNNIFFDISWNRSFSNEDYYMFTTLSEKSTFKYNSSMIGATIGAKF